MTRTLLLASLLLVASVPSAPVGASTSGAAPAIEQAVLDPGRSDADIERDAREHPLEMLEFIGARPGLVVLDLFAGGGYYSELLGHIVGSHGKVYLHNNAAYLGFAGKALEERLATGRLGTNVVRLDAEIGQLGIAPASVDVVMIVMSYHDLYYHSSDWSIDPAVFFDEISTLLKPGGVLAITDHSAIAGSGESAAQELHRIDEGFARADIESRGFRFDGALEILRNPDDDRTVNVFDPAIRGKTDRFAHRYVRL